MARAARCTSETCSDRSSCSESSPSRSSARARSAAWTSLRGLHEHQISHGDLRAVAITVSDGTALFGGFGNAEYGASDTQLLSAIVEATNMPHASRYGVRLLGEVGFRLGAGYSAAFRGGYQARDSASGGTSAGMTVGYAF